MVNGQTSPSRGPPRSRRARRARGAARAGRARRRRPCAGRCCRSRAPPRGSPGTPPPAPRSTPRAARPSRSTGIPTRGGVLAQQLVAARHEPRLERARLRVEAGVEQRGVRLAGAGAHVRAGLEQRHAQVEPAQLTRDRAADHARADDRHIRVGRAPAPAQYRHIRRLSAGGTRPPRRPRSRARARGPSSSDSPRPCRSCSGSMSPGPEKNRSAVGELAELAAGQPRAHDRVAVGERLAHLGVGDRPRVDVRAQRAGVHHGGVRVRVLALGVGREPAEVARRRGSGRWTVSPTTFVASGATRCPVALDERRHAAGRPRCRAASPARSRTCPPRRPCAGRW